MIKYLQTSFLIFILIGLSHYGYSENKTRINLVKIDNRTNTNLLDSLAVSGEVKLSYNNAKRIHIEYKIDSLSQNELIKYKIDGFDNEWIETNEFKQIVITNLAPGRYDIKVGIFANSKSLEENWFHLLIQPPFWETFWFKLVQLSLIILIFLAVYLKNIQLRRKLKKITGYNKS